MRQQTNSTEVMGVLFASTFPEIPALDKSMATTKQLFGGVVVAEEIEIHSARPKKRARTTKSKSHDSSDVSDEGKKRGRPRVEASEESAVDRRRTQIRLAQRAYRTRKETTITTLKEKVDGMHDSIDRMNQIFMNLYDNLHEPSIFKPQGDVARQLEMLRSEFGQLSKSDGDSDHANNKLDINANKRKPAQDSPPFFETAQLHKSVAQSTQTTVRQPQSTIEYHHNSSDSGLRSSSDGSVEACDSYFDLSPRTVVNEQSLQIDSLATFGMTSERVFPAKTFYTYSFQETSFARRLHRLCIERAFRNLNNPGMDPAWISKTFRFKIANVNRHTLRDRFRDILQRKAGESLEDWQFPYYHVGGAGTHYPRRDAFGRPIFPPNLQSPLLAPGPWEYVEARSGMREAVVQNMLDSIGFGGEWFDAHDVEEYLKTKGVYLDAQSSFVDIDTSNTNIAQPLSWRAMSAADSTSTLAHSPVSSDSNFFDTNNSALVVPDLDQALDSTIHASTVEEKGAFGDFGSMYNWNDVPDVVPKRISSPGSVPTFEHVLERRTGIITFDVEKFLDRMVGGGACLGRAPGFRKEAVDSALALAIQEAF